MGPDSPAVGTRVGVEVVDSGTGELVGVSVGVGVMGSGVDVAVAAEVGVLGMGVGVIEGVAVGVEVGDEVGVSGAGDELLDAVDVDVGFAGNVVHVGRIDVSIVIVAVRVASITVGEGLACLRVAVGLGVAVITCVGKPLASAESGPSDDVGVALGAFPSAIGGSIVSRLSSAGTPNPITALATRMSATNITCFIECLSHPGPAGSGMGTLYDY